MDSYHHPALGWLHQRIYEPFNCISHFIGMLLSIAGMVILLALSQGDPWRIVSFSIYGACAILLFSASTLLHGLVVAPHVREWLLRFDHIGIYAFIAGSYTPVLLVSIQDYSPAWSWSLFGVVWGLGIGGMIFKSTWLGAPRWLSTGLYLLLGWLALVGIVPLVNAMPIGGFLWLLAGGLFYSVGAVIFTLQRPNLIPEVFGYHELWHLFVLAGSICHFFMLLFYVLPQ
jgi:hemolysin III